MFMLNGGKTIPSRLVAISHGTENKGAFDFVKEPVSKSFAYGQRQARRLARRLIRGARFWRHRRTWSRTGYPFLQAGF